MEPGPSLRHSARPQSVKELVAQAEDFSFNANIPLKHWTRAAETLYQEASFALSDGDYGRAYVMLYRHSVLVLKLIPTHTQFREPENRKAFKSLSKRVDSVLEDLEHLKPEVENAYNEWERMRPQDRTPAGRSAAASYAEFAARDPSLSGSAKILDASEHQELAVDLAQKELMRRDTLRRATKRAGLSDQETQARRRAGLWENIEGPLPSEEADLQRQIEATRRTLDSPRRRDDAVYDYDRESALPPAAQHYNYPSISKSRPVQFERSQSREAPPVPAHQPARPPKGDHLAARRDPAYDIPARDSSMPSVPRKLPLDNYQALVPLPPSSQAGPPGLPSKEPIEAPTLPKKERLTFKPGAYLENGDPVRSIFLPTKLRKAFLEIASDNTRAGLEMCGILCGTPVNNALFIRCLLIPDQISTSDTCETENETTMFDYCDSEDLLVVGWIHTHPTQTCFMSSRDLHTHAGYQIMMPESVAIVCAPKFTPSYGIFRLTNPPGLEHILQCTHNDTFHQHSIDNLYREAERPHGHVYESDKLPFYVKDLRTK